MVFTETFKAYFGHAQYTNSYNEEIKGMIAIWVTLIKFGQKNVKQSMHLIGVA